MEHQSFTVIASRSTSSIHFQPASASNLTFWIDKPTASFHFDDLNHTLIQCSQGKTTALGWGGYGVGLVSPLTPLKHQHPNSLTVSPHFTGLPSPRRPRRLHRLQRRPLLQEPARAILPRWTHRAFVQCDILYH